MSGVYDASGWIKDVTSPNCGDSWYDGDSVCGHACGREYVAFLNEVI